MKILVVNAGSSSLKYQLVDMADESVIAKGLCERIGIGGSRLVYKPAGKGTHEFQQDMKDHTDAIRMVLDALVDPEIGVIKSMSEIDAVGHRVVHGGEKFSSSVLLTDDVLKTLDELSELAPLHNPANLMGINACRAIMPDAPMVGVFDTAFHQTMPQEAFLYGLPYEDYKELMIRRYGFHGTSHAYVSGRAAEKLNMPKEESRIITCHLGNGSSITAVKGGKSIDTSMGFTPLEGLVMGTRSGDIDPAIVTYMREVENLDQGVANEILNKKSGVLGISGVSSDFRDLERAVEEGNERALLALKVFAHKVRFYIGAYIAEMNGCDAIVFTAGVGENDMGMRDIICNDLGNLGIKLDVVKNRVRGKETIISRDDSKVKIILIPTNEELMIARDTYQIVTGKMK